MNTVSHLLGHLSPSLVYAVVAGAVLAESVLLIGAFIPSLTLLLTAGALARSGDISLPLVIATAAAAVVAGDLLAHRTGRLLGTRLRTGRMGRRVPPTAWRQAERLMSRHGGRAVFIARFLPVVRTLAPHFAGATHLPYRSMAPYSVTAACLWASAEISAGYAAAASLVRILTWVHRSWPRSLSSCSAPSRSGGGTRHPGAAMNRRRRLRLPPRRPTGTGTSLGRWQAASVEPDCLCSRVASLNCSRTCSWRTYGAIRRPPHARPHLLRPPRVSRSS